MLGPTESPHLGPEKERWTSMATTTIRKNGTSIQFTVTNHFTRAGFNCGEPTVWSVDGLRTDMYSTHEYQSPNTPHAVPEVRFQIF